jgi:hypothetical protein
MKTDVHFICEQCGADYRADAAKAEACERRHAQVEKTMRIVGVRDFPEGSRFAQYMGRPRTLLVEFADADGAAWTLRYETSDTPKAKG